MASRRMISTGMFQDPWVGSLSKDATLLWVYLFLNCDHAGIIDVEHRRWSFDTKIDAKDIPDIIKEINGKLVSFKSGEKIFIPNFIKFQYPGWPNSNVKAQKSAIDILCKYKLSDDEGIINDIPFDYKPTVIEPLLKGKSTVSEVVTEQAEDREESDTIVPEKDYLTKGLSPEGEVLMKNMYEWFDFTVNSKMDRDVRARISKIDRVGMLKRLAMNTLYYLKYLEESGSIKYRVSVKNWLGLGDPNFRTAGRWNDGTNYEKQYKDSIQFGTKKGGSLKGGLVI